MLTSLILAINFAHRPNVGALVLGLSAIALAFYMRQRRAKNPLYDLHFVGRRTFWVAAGAGIIVFGSLMSALFIGQQYLQNLQGYSTFEAGLSILPAPSSWCWSPRSRPDSSRRRVPASRCCWASSSCRLPP